MYATHGPLPRSTTSRPRRGRSVVTHLSILAVLMLAGCRRAESEATPSPIPRESRMEVLERVRQKRAPGEDIQRVADGVARFQVRYGRIPSNVQELVSTRILNAPPDPPEGMVYMIDPLTGNVQLLREADVHLRTRRPLPP